MGSRTSPETCQFGLFVRLDTLVSLRRYKVELSRPFLVEERAFGFIASAPMFVSTRHKKEFAWPNTLFSSVILIQVRAFNDDDGNIVRVSVGARVVSRIEFSECGMRAFVRIPP